MAFGFGGFMEPDPPEQTMLCGKYLNSSEGELVYSVPIKGQVPRFNAFVYTQALVKIGRIDEVFGNIDDILFSVRPAPGVQPNSFTEGDEVYCSVTKIDPVEKIISLSTPPAPTPSRGGRAGGRGGFRGRPWLRQPRWTSWPWPGRSRRIRI